MKIKKIFTNLLVIFCLVTSVHADISYTPAVKGGDGIIVPRIKIFGKIRSEDVQQFQLLKDAAKISAQSTGINSKEQWPLLIELDSLGGSVSAALSLGKAIRDANPLTVNVSEGASCVSACVLVLAGGVTRYVVGRVGIHRPYVNDDKADTVSSQKKHYAEIEKQVKNYLSYVNVPTSLYDVMFRIPPEKVRFLSSKELQEYNLNEDDPYYKEATDAAMAKSYGLTKSEYQKGKSECSRSPSPKAANDCFAKLLINPHKN